MAAIVTIPLTNLQRKRLAPVYREMIDAYNKGEHGVIILQPDDECKTATGRFLPKSYALLLVEMCSRVISKEKEGSDG